MGISLLSRDFGDTGLLVRHSATVRPTQFQVLGERSSGTNLLKRLVGRNTELKASEALGWKHGFSHAVAVPEDFLVLCVVRNAADWAISMHAKPWHSSIEMQQMGFSDFIRTPWLTEIDSGRYFPDARRIGAVGQPLQYDRHPLTGEPLANLFELRRMKLQALTGWFNRHATVALVRLETVTEAPEAFLDALTMQLGLPRGDAFSPVLKRLGSKFRPRVAERPATPPSMNADDTCFMCQTLDLELEAALGYTY
ncbi:hypothetical protein [Mesobacterium pallidum]|uniref:hypothetical protein n=1 Tax=Mesobacterium pallidum TaxID=2872037 RepID=UPI001EE2CB87|nr:hypothetical protein [Mesobacterium pallidum]